MATTYKKNVYKRRKFKKKKKTKSKNKNKNIKMSIFPCQNPFQPRRASARKLTTISPLQMDASQRAQEFGLDYGPAILRLEDDLTVEFDPKEGEWFNDSEPTNINNKKRDKASENLNNAQQKLLSTGIQLQEENEVLKSKNEILINMIAEVYSEFKLERDRKIMKN